MSSTNVKELMNELYDALRTTTADGAVSIASRKVLREPLGTLESVEGTLKLALAVGIRAVFVKWAQRKKYLPVDLFKG